MITIRGEAPGDIGAIHSVNLSAFPQPAEAFLVDKLREHKALRYSLVAEMSNGKLVGHLAISPVTIIADAQIYNGLGLGPMAVHPDFQNQGIGSRLVRHWFSECASPEDQVLVVLGHPRFYPRFGFKPAYQYGIRCEYDVPDDTFMVAPLAPGALDRIKGLVKYHSAFADVGEPTGEG